MKRIKKLAILVMCGLELLNINATSTYAAFDNQIINEELNANAKPDHIVLTWSDDPKTTQTISWRTDTSVNTAVVKYWEQGNRENTEKEAIVTAKSFSTSVKRGDTAGKMNLYSITLKNLKPGKTYCYEVGSGGLRGETNTFHTEELKKDNFKFIIFGDSQNNKINYNAWHDTVNNAYEANKDAKFIVNMGDLVEIGQKYIHWNNWFDASKGVIDSIPEMPITGNHECKDAVGDGHGQPEYFLKQFNVFNNGPKGYKGKTYSYDYGNAHIAVLDSQLYDECSNLEEEQEMLRTQIAWLDNDLSKSKKLWKFVLYHKPQYYMKKDRTNSELKGLEAIFDKYHVDVVFNGHEHGLARTFPINKGEYKSKADQGTVYYITGRSNMNTKSDLSPKVWDSYYFDPQNLPVYETVEIRGSKLTIKAFEQNGNIVDDFVIDKANPQNNTLMVPSGRLGDTRMVLFGTPIVYGKKPVFENNKWYVDFKLLLNFMDAKYNKEENSVSFKKPKVKVYVNDEMFKDSTRAMISVEALKELGFSCEYQSSTNYLLIEKIKNG